MIMGKHNNNINFFLRDHTNHFSARVYGTKSAPPSPSGKSRPRFQPASTSFDDLDLPPQNSTTKPLFCCQACTVSIRDPSFDDFLDLVSNSRPPFNGSVKSLGSFCEHVITVTTSLKKKPALNTPQRSVRYFAFIKKDGLITLGEYREIDSILYTFLLDTSSFEETTNKARFACATHHRYQLVRQDRSADNSTESEEFSYLRTPAPTQPITEGEGESRPVLSRKDLSYEKRKFMVIWLRYGRQYQVDEMVESIKAEERDRDKRTSWDWEWEEQLEEERKLEQREEEAKSEQVKLEERIDFEIKHCLGKMRMLFLIGKKYVGA